MSSLEEKLKKYISDRNNFIFHYVDVSDRVFISMNKSMYKYIYEAVDYIVNNLTISSRWRGLEAPILYALTMQTQMFCMLFLYIKTLNIGEDENCCTQLYKLYEQAKIRGLGKIIPHKWNSYNMNLAGNTYQAIGFIEDSLFTALLKLEFE